MRKFYLDLKFYENNPPITTFYDGNVEFQFEEPTIAFFFLSSPEGLGYDNSHTYSSIGDGFYKNVEYKISQQTISGKLIIRNNKFYFDSYYELGRIYKSYQELFLAIEMAKEIYFVYDPFGNGVKKYRRLVEIQSVTKTEIATNGILEVPISFKCLTPWFLEDPDSVEMLSDRDRCMRYTYTHTEDLIYGDVKDAFRGVITNVGSLSASLIIRIHSVKSPKTVLPNPIIRLIDSETAEELGRCEIGIDLHKQETIEMSSLPLDSYVKKINADGTEEDLINKLNVIYDPFLRIPAGRTCEIIIETNATASDAMPEEVSVVAYYFTRVV